MATWRPRWIATRPSCPVWCCSPCWVWSGSAAAAHRSGLTRRVAVPHDLGPRRPVLGAAQRTRLELALPGVAAAAGARPGSPRPGRVRHAASGPGEANPCPERSRSVASAPGKQPFRSVRDMPFQGTRSLEHVPTVLDDIVAGVRVDLVGRQRSRRRPTWRPDRRAARGPRRRGGPSAAPGVAVIAEVKRSSPSKGTLADIADPAALAAAYAAGGAAAITVLTEERRFAGSLDDLAAVRRRVASGRCCARTSLVEPYQLLEARAAGADLVLLIVAALGQRDLVALHDQARAARPDRPRRGPRRGRDPARRRRRGRADRRQRAQPQDPDGGPRTSSAGCARCIPGDVVKVAESGIREAADVQRVRRRGRPGGARRRGTGDGTEPPGNAWQR